MIAPGRVADEASDRHRESAKAVDALFVAVLVAAPFLFYAFDLGFYSDDWPILATMRLAPQQSLLGIVRSLAEVGDLWMRPVLWAYLAVSYMLFGMNPLGYHLIIAAVLVVAAVLCYFVLCELAFSRVLAVSVALVYGLLPHYATTRFWISITHANLAVLFYFLSLYADLRSVRAHAIRVGSWKAVSVLGLLLSTLAYEVTMPLFALNALFVWRRRVHESPNRSSRGILAAAPVVNLVALGAVAVFKWYTTVRLDAHMPYARLFAWIVSTLGAWNYGPGDSGLNLKEAVKISFGTYGFALPLTVARVARSCPDGATFGLCGLVALIVYWHLKRALRESGWPEPARSKRLMAWGPGVFLAGYSIFLTNGNIQVTATGVGNRTAIAAAIGIAMWQIGLTAWLIGRVASERWRASIFAACVASLCASSVLIGNTLASFWKDSYNQQQAVLSELLERMPRLPRESSLILDGVCPYRGPASVFENCWDLAGALQIVYNDPTLRADVTSRKLAVKEDGVSTFVYDVPCQYPYKNLFSFSLRQHALSPVTDADAARRILQPPGADSYTGCPVGHEGYGVPVF